jgi:DNA-binding CsgD family transcriptional regulator
MVAVGLARRIADAGSRSLQPSGRFDLELPQYPGINNSIPTTERFTRYVHDPNNSNTLIGDSVESIVRDRRGYLSFGTSESGLDRFDPNTKIFTHYRNDRDGQCCWQDYPRQTLTPAEVVVLRLIAAGNANKQIADQLGITADTVKGRVKSILAKLDANDRAHAAIIGLKRGIIEL